MTKKKMAWVARMGIVAWLLAAAGGAARGEDGYYAGTCADGRALYFLLTDAGTNARVSLRLEGSSPAEFLWWTNTAGGREFGNGESAGEETNPRRPVSGIWLDRQQAAPRVSGTLAFDARTNRLGFSAHRVALKAELQRKHGLHLWGRGGSKAFTACWPDFRDGVPFHGAISKRLAAESDGSLARFTAGASGVAWEGIKGGGRSYDWEGMLTTEIVWLGANVVSLFQVRYEFTGGAHGNTSTQGRNFILAGGKAREFALPELFLPGPNWVRTVSDACLRELQRGSLFTLSWR